MKICPLLCETNLDIIRAVMEKEKPEIAVIDSIQTMYNEEVGSAPGSVSTGTGINECTDADCQREWEFRSLSLVM